MLSSVTFATRILSCRRRLAGENVFYSAFQTFRQSAFRERNENTEYFA